MELLLQLGHPTVLPINGPNDGLPQYEDAAKQEMQERVSRTRGRPKKGHRNTDDWLTASPAKNTRSRARPKAEAEVSIEKSTRS